MLCCAAPLQACTLRLHGGPAHIRSCNLSPGSCYDTPAASCLTPNSPFVTPLPPLQFVEGVCLAMGSFVLIMVAVSGAVPHPATRAALVFTVLAVVAANAFEAGVLLGPWLRR